MKNQDERISATLSQIEQAFVYWANESKESPENFESINTKEMNVDEINEYAKACAEYLFAKLQES
jgi:hypothetical protein